MLKKIKYNNFDMLKFTQQLKQYKELPYALYSNIQILFCINSSFWHGQKYNISQKQDLLYTHIVVNNQEKHY